MLRSILIGIDNSASGIAAQELGVRWAKRFNARLTGVTVVSGPGPQLLEAVACGDAYHTADGESPIAVVHRVVHQEHGLAEDRFRERCHEVGVSFELLGDVGSPHVQILVEAQNHDIILLGQPSHFEFGRKSNPRQTVEKVIQNSPRPVVAVPAVLDGGESIVVAYDGSLQASRALSAFEASGLGCGVEVHVVSVGNPRDATRCAERAITFLRSHRIEATPQIVVTSLAPAESIVKKVRSLDAGVIVMGAYGQSVLREFFLGSVTRTILKECRVPVFCFH